MGHHNGRGTVRGDADPVGRCFNLASSQKSYAQGFLVLSPLRVDGSHAVPFRCSEGKYPWEETSL